MILKSKLFSSLFVVTGCLVVLGPSLASCSSDCSDRDDCGPYMPPGGTSSGSGGDAGAPDHGGTAGTNSGGKSGNAAGGSATEGGAGATSGTGGAGEGGEGGTVVALPCDGACEPPTAVCDVSDDTCVECLEEQDCTGEKTKCDTDARACVECLESPHCTDAKLARCNAGSCAKCTANEDCAHIAGKTVCDTKAGECVQCTVTNETPCNGKSCNPATKSCTTTSVGSQDICEPCVADSECTGGNKADPDTRCIAMQFQGDDRADGFCLRRVAKTCARPFQTPKTGASLSGAASEQYCGIDEEAARCEAVLDLLASAACSNGMDSACGCPRDMDGACTSAGTGGLCRTVGVNANQCTYACGVTNNCPQGTTCTAGQPYCH